MSVQYVIKKEKEDFDPRNYIYVIDENYKRAIEIEATVPAEGAEIIMQVYTIDLDLVVTTERYEPLPIPGPDPGPAPTKQEANEIWFVCNEPEKVNKNTIYESVDLKDNYNRVDNITYYPKENFGVIKFEQNLSLIRHIYCNFQEDIVFEKVIFPNSVITLSEVFFNSEASVCINELFFYGRIIHLLENKVKILHITNSFAPQESYLNPVDLDTDSYTLQKIYYHNADYIFDKNIYMPKSSWLSFRENYINAFSEKSWNNMWGINSQQFTYQDIKIICSDGEMILR